MNHIAYEEWQRYVLDEIPEENRNIYETHLQTCDECMEVYLSALESQESSLPDLHDHSQFIERIMQEIEESGLDEERLENKRRPFYQQIIFHYSVAAAMTILLLTTGVFNSILNYVDDIGNITLSEEKASITDQILQKFESYEDLRRNGDE